MSTISPGDLGIGRPFQNVRDAVVVADPAGRIALWNPAAADIFGYTAEEALGRDVAMLVPEALRDRHLAGLARFRELGRGEVIDARHPVELPARRKDGAAIEVEMTLSRVEAPAGAGAYVMAIIRDVTERRRGEEERTRLGRKLAARVEAEAALGELAAIHADLANRSISPE